MQKQTQQGLHLAPLAVTAVVCTLRWLEGARPALETGSKRQQTKKEKKNKRIKRVMHIASSAGMMGKSAPLM